MFAKLGMTPVHLPELAQQVGEQLQGRPGGAVSLAAILAGKPDVRGKVVAAVLSGGNVDPELFYKLVA